LSSRSTLCVFFCYGEGKKEYRCFDPITQKFYVSCHVLFLKHISFFSIPSPTHSLIRSDLIRIDIFSKDSNSLSSQVSSTSNTLPHVRLIHTNHSTSTDSLLSSISKAPFSSIVPQTLFEIMDPLLHQSIHICKSTKLPNFAYFCYSSSFTSFLAFIHCLSEPSFYKETILDPLWQQAMDEELSILHKIDT
jgi:hypothetical protein